MFAFEVFDGVQTKRFVFVCVAVVWLFFSGWTKVNPPAQLYAVVNVPGNDFDREKSIVPETWSTSDSEFAFVFKVCKLSVEELVDFVEDKPWPACIIFVPVAFVKLANESAELLSE